MLLAVFVFGQQVTVFKAQSEPTQGYRLTVKVVDENGVAVSDVRLKLAAAGTQTVSRGETDVAGRYNFSWLNSGSYQLKIEKEGFYAFATDLIVQESQSVEFTIYHQQEIAETVNVFTSSPAIDPEKTALAETLTNREILTLPYPSTRDYRKALPLIPGVVADASDQIHLGGSATHQVLDQLDGFNITHPVSGLLEIRLSPDTLRTVDVQSSRSSAEYGKGSGGNLRLTTAMGDDSFRFTATNFIPSFQNRKRLNFSEWTPRATLSGPLRRKKAWFFEGIGGVYNLTIVPELTTDADRATSLLVHNLIKAQVNLNPRNILTTSFLVNHFQTDSNGLSRFDPIETTTKLNGSAYLVALKEQFYARNGALLEMGFAVNQFRSSEQPKGELPYRLTPEGRRGNFFRTSEAKSRRWQWIGSLTLPAVRLHGTHELKFGGDLDLITFDQTLRRRQIIISRQNDTVSRQITFLGGNVIKRRNFEASAYLQDRWSVSKSLLVEAGLRFDRDSIIKQTSVSPRLAATNLLTRDGNTKLSIGIGVYHDATNLEIISRNLAGQRLDQFYAPDGTTPLGPQLITSFQVNERSLDVPRYVNWSLGAEHKLPGEIFLNAEFMQKRGRDVFAFFSSAQSGQVGGEFILRNARRDSYDSLQITLRRAFKNNYAVLASYIRSRSRANAVLDPSIENPVFGQRAEGPLPWDTPNHLIFWGWMPLIKKFDFAYSLVWRDGFPFSVVNEQQQLVGAPNSHRFPTYFTLNTHIERRFSLFGYYLALRAGFNNVTNRQNPTVVNNNVDSPQFLTFGGIQDRSFTGRIRFLGRK